MTTTTPMSDVATAIARYAQRLHAACGTGHHVASPLGAWLLLALCASASTGRTSGRRSQAHDGTREELSDVLGMDADAAAEVARTLLEHPHPLVRSAAAVWSRPIGDVAALGGWIAGLPPAVTHGDMPTQPELDTWARDHTYGLIEKFPLTVTAETVVLLATALATKVSWRLPFDAVPAAALAPSPWAGVVERVLRTPKQYGHRQFIASTAAAGDVAVHTAYSQPGEHDEPRHHRPLLVTSVIGAADVPPATMLAEAHRIACAVAVHDDVPSRSLFDLPLGESPLWTIDETATTTNAPDGREELCVAVLPAWTARSEHDLTRADVGMLSAARALAQLLGMDEFQYEAKQAAVATYDRTGFEAAAVTAMDVALGAAMMPRHGVRRTATLRFGHPYAVVAVTSHQSPEHRYDRPSTAPWHGLPVFSAWVAEPTSA